jgi:hypothetical protein
MDKASEDFALLDERSESRVVVLGQINIRGWL